jgi:hypothetical protein
MRKLYSPSRLAVTTFAVSVSINLMLYLVVELYFHIPSIQEVYHKLETDLHPTMEYEVKTAELQDEMERGNSDPAIKTGHNGVTLIPCPSDDHLDPLVSAPFGLTGDISDSGAGNVRIGLLSRNSRFSP